jgi:ribose transport system ATP-binding protein
MSKKYKPKSPKDAIKQSIGLVPENRKKEGICQILPVWENATVASLNKLSHQGILKIGELKTIVKGYIKDLSIKTPSENTICRNLSGGNQQKVVLSKWLIKDSEFLLVDEPTQGIDVGAKDQIYNIIMDTVAKGKSVLIVSSELDELVKICNKIAVMYEGQQINIFDMDTTDKNAIHEAAITGRVG